ncbi:MBL fold metallo-hydrolase [Acuticoccus sp. M5D2P5]|uniref:MBL fold metallo-hydrolase n=1 Tax=Acuticoccus kalidii TaxID=2910977 RepID=UPI001F2C5F07|nr:MBL fold metallo-hydrolase [Acuticoccus kalidii]MCF3933514.1 MBL fold metallo-hydrolase [Acuticoccus kalidii]
MTVSICRACGTAFPNAPAPPTACLICEDDRQFVPREGQSWTTPEALAASHGNVWRRHAPGLYEIRTSPAFAIGQRAFLIRTPSGNVLWDCLTLLDAATDDLVTALGGVSAIAVSHPHYYTAMADWAERFGAPIYLHRSNEPWVVRPSGRIVYFEEEALPIAEGATLIRLGGHFPGGAVLHLADDGDGGALFSGDIVQVAPGGDRVSFLYSYPNMMPLAGATVARIADRLAEWRFERIYGAFAKRECLADGNGVVARSAARYQGLLEGGAEQD